MIKNNKMKILKKYNILYVEDDHEIAEEIMFFLEPNVKNIYLAYDGKEGLEHFIKYKPDIIITDIQMPKMNGIKMIEEIRKINSEIPIIITTAFNESDYLLKAINLKVDGYLIKPLSFKEMTTVLYKIIEPLELRQELINKNLELQNINKNLDLIAKEKTKELENLYNHDPLTGLSNFINLGEEIETGIYKYLILLDISNFSLINKQYGKIFANNVLKETANELKEHLTDDMRLFKTESDRFVFLTKEKNNKKIEEFCEQIISFFDTKLLNINDFEININFSIGVAKITKEYFPLVNAEYALEIGKKIGSRYYYFFDESTESINKAKETIKWINATKKMIENDMIEPYYQAIADVNSGEIIKYEVLARADYNGELLSPYIFINSAERLGLINSITRMIINKSFEYFKESDINFSINITQRDLIDKQFLSFLEQKLQRNNITPSRVTFEVLESVVTGDHHALVLTQLSSLKEMGFEIAIDDFGVENSNFNRLLEIDFDYIKLDGLFIKALQKSKKDRVVVEAIVSLAKTLNIKTIAEYVENNTIHNIVKECGIDMAQGYYIGEPQSEVLACKTLKAEYR